MTDPDLSGRVAVVTGASRGAGKGVALALGRAGATVFVTGRTTEPDDAAPGTIGETAAEVSARGGRGIPVRCDAGAEADVAALFERVRVEAGRLDILVNNACHVPDGLTSRRPFWDKPLDHARMIDVGLRSTFVASWFAAPLLIETRGGLVVNTSSFGGTCYMHGPVYGAVKAGVDKMAHDMAEDLRPYDVAAVSLWMGMLRTERTAAMLDHAAQRYGPLAAQAESAQFPGRVIAALAVDRDRMRRSGHVLISAELGAELGVRDVDGSAPVSHREALGSPPQYAPAVVR
jgi:NAD(P)-dependent dehydrogenase (short-subunit alcohol dehydrogenase family)